MLKRSIDLSVTKRHSCFLWGARQTGKSTLLRMLYSDALVYDLLLADVYRRFVQNPSLIREEILFRKLSGDNQVTPIIIDEVQKIPELLDEVHWMIERLGLRFILCGSSARRMKRGQANLLGGRAPTLHLHPLTVAEIPEFDLTRALNQGLLPSHYLGDNQRIFREAYVGTYLRDEIAAEAIVRNLPAFGRFLEVAALANGEMVVFQNIARECGVSAPTIKAYYEILEETLLGRFLPSYMRRARRRVVQAPRFYFFDVGIVGTLTRRGMLEQGSELWGRAFEHFIFMELSAWQDYQHQAPLAYWRTASQIEVDFILNDGEVAVEIKSTTRATSHDLRGLRAFKEEYKPKRCILVSADPRPRLSEDGIEILPWNHFLQELWSGDIVKE